MEAVVAYFKILPRYLPGGVTEIMTTLKSWETLRSQI
jgi:hypothetical protein